RYLQALATLAGATGREAGVRRLAAGSPAGECSGCTRGRIAAEAVRLVRAGARAGADDAPAHIERAIVAACPVGVLQRAALSTGLRASSG
ncbi:MAG TPA: hypothetical protein VHG08_16225, partial [Longimicrobium sp.]|nr:hypothetical protein [Longimicrobium sp.]